MKKVPSQERRRRSADDRSDKKFDSAVDRLERAIDDLVETSPGDEEATEYVEKAGRRLRTEARRRRREERPERRNTEGRPRRERVDGVDDGVDRDEDYDDDRRYGAEVWWGSSNWNRWEWGGRNRSRKLYRDVDNEKIGGVCAGIANYYGVEPWVVRCMAVTGLIFMPSVTLPAYWIAYFAMDKPPKKSRKRRTKRVRRRRRERDEDMRAHEPADRSVEEELFEEIVEEPQPASRRRPAARAIEAPSQTTELGLHWSPRASLRYIHSDLDEIELRLRRMESHVTSGQYELQRELKKIGAES